jgi:hypothetical protein
MKETIVNFLLNQEWFMSIVKQRFLATIEDIDCNPHANGCGLEDNGITNRYHAMEYGWDRAIDQVLEAVDNII